MNTKDIFFLQISLSLKVREIIDDTVKAELLEEQIFTIADRMYSAWAPAENNSIAEIPKASVAGGWTQLWSLTDSSENLDPTARFVEMLQSNVAILWSVRTNLRISNFITWVSYFSYHTGD